MTCALTGSGRRAGKDKIHRVTLLQEPGRCRNRLQDTESNNSERKISAFDGVSPEVQSQPRDGITVNASLATQLLPKALKNVQPFNYWVELARVAMTLGAERASHNATSTSPLVLRKTHGQLARSLRQ